MNLLKTSALGVLLSVCMLHAAAQDTRAHQNTKAQQNVKNLPISQYDYSKPKLFKDLPDRIKAPLKDFDHVFNLTLGKTVDLAFASNFQFSGVVFSKAEDVAANVKSIVIKSTNRAGASLVMSRIINDDNTITYKGNIVSFNHGDAYEIIHENGSYYLIKKGFYDLVEE